KKPGRRGQESTTQAKKQKETQQPDTEQRNQYAQGKIGEIRAKRIGHGAQRDREQAQEDESPIPVPALKTQNEGQQIEGESNNPQQGDGCDVLRDVIGDGEEKRRSTLGQAGP